MLSIVSCHLILDGNRHRKNHIERRQIVVMFSNTLNFPEEPYCCNPLPITGFLQAQERLKC